MRTTSKSKSFIEVLDGYKSKKDLNYTDYLTVLSLINKSYNENIQPDNFMKFSSNYYSENSSSIWNTSNILNNTNMNNKKDVSNNSQGLFNIFCPTTLNKNDLLKNSYSNIYFNNDIFKHSPEPRTNPYLLWQKQHDVSNIFNNNTITIKKTKKIVIDVSMNTIDDIIKLLADNEYKEDTEYNIDLKSLHNIKDDLIALNTMIGMSELKQSVIDQLFYFIQDLHLGKNISDYKNTVFYGSPGTGKTDVAKIIGKMYSKLGILKNNVFKKVTRNDLIAGYLGQTAIKTRKVIDECMGGVLFIDEAYSLGNSDNGDSYSKECLDVLCEAMSDNKKELMVIIAGYEEELNETFFRVNKGLQSRFIWRFNMGKYTPKELKLIFVKMINEQEWSYVDDLGLLDKWFDDKKDDFKNYGRDIELLLTYVKIAHGRRIYGKDIDLKKKITMDDLKTGHQTYLSNKKLKPVPNFMHTIYV